MDLRPGYWSALFALWIICLAPASAGRAAEPDYRKVSGPCALTFPRDHADHPDYRTEWWYYTGHLKAESGARFGFQLTFFRHRIAPPAERGRWPEQPSAWRTDQVYLAHAAITDVQGGKHASAERTARAAVHLAGTDVAGDAVTIHLGTWSARIAPTRHHLEAGAEDFTFKLDLEPIKGPTAHGQDGYSRKGGEPSQASCYYSFTRLAVWGRVNVGGNDHAVEGQAWMDHEFSTAPLEPGLVGWDWFSLQLDDGRDLMLFSLRRPDGTWHPASSGTLVMPDGSARHLARESVRLEVVRRWKSPHTGAVYPAGWRLSVEEAGLRLKIDPVLNDQEMRTGASTGVVYWEGAVDITADSDGPARKGGGYVEMTGYARAFDAPM